MIGSSGGVPEGIAELGGRCGPSAADSSTPTLQQGNSWQTLDEGLQALLDMQIESQRIMEEQVAFLARMRNFVAAQQLPETGTPAMTEPQPFQMQQPQPPQPQPQQQHAVQRPQPQASPSLLQQGPPPAEELENRDASALGDAIAIAMPDQEGIALRSNFRVTKSLSMEDLQEPEVPPRRDGALHWVRAHCARILKNRFFEPMISFFIIGNAATIGWAIDRELRGEDNSVLDLVEHVFLTIFTLELALRLFVEGQRSCCKFWTIFDFVLVASSAMSIWILDPLYKNQTSKHIFGDLQRALVLRMLRLLRLARAARLLVAFSSVWKLVSGLMQSLSTMVSAFALIFGTIYIFACLGAEFITKDYQGDPEVGALIEEKFATLPQVLMTLFQFVSMDSIAAVYMPLVFRNPLFVLYFVPLFALVSIALMNLITALLVEDVISNARMDEEMESIHIRQRINKLMPNFRELFRTLDSSNDGSLEIKEVVEAVKKGVDVPQELREIINPTRIVDLFNALDADGSGAVSETEFVEGLCHVALSDVPVETTQMLHLLRTVRREIMKANNLATLRARPAALGVSRTSRSQPVDWSLGGVFAI